ncbi:hypothetical protein BGZ61DRAFT_483227 [Ilyonectria robusta]|uniref:uncharacterized protein n=1 Tax=Ilyonectria robusta TaxID=1079257 RepID=UPI001E8DAEAB|nr:uncharacterized protein BGZ61DRAFT_483227 [Ilyonectria robusta]KAH8669922.1 hypothetical protein BGZ61DRAFT_483227 [Ilyonectria robusta]
MRQSTHRINTEESGQSSSSATVALGLEEWHNGDDPDVDIIFIHGLMGHREKTWRGTDDDGRKLEPWPKALLPSKIPNSRIFTFGYDAHVFNLNDQGKVSVKAIRDHAKELVASVEHERTQTNTAGRPMIFVCHSLGGLVCKDAILFSAQRRDREDLMDFSQHTAGIIFMGTPHRGSAIADYATRFSSLVGSFKQTNPKLLQVLQRESDTLHRIHDDFYDLVNGRRNSIDQHKISVICFWEELPSPNAGLIVPKESAVLPGFADRGIHANHKNMAKFISESDPGYQAFVQELNAIISKVTQWTTVPRGITSRVQHGQTSPILPTHTSTTASNGPWFLLPYSRNEFFVGRSSTLQQLNSWLGSPLENRHRGIHKRAALHGLGGVGKTQVVIEWAYEMRQRDDGLSIFWVHASTTERFIEAYTSIARTCQIPGASAGGSDLLKKVKEWLGSSHQQHPWLMIVDNADDIEVFLERSGDAGYRAKMHKYLPSSPNGSVLFTSRSKHAAVDLTEGRTLITITEPSPEECIDLIRGRLPASTHTVKDISSLAKELGYLPLALSQAISYLQRNSLSVPQYLDMLREGSGDGLRDMLQDEFTEAGRDNASENQVPNAVARTWLASFRTIERENSFAIELLYLCGSFDRQEIPRSFFTRYRTHYDRYNSDLSYKRDDDNDFEEHNVYPYDNVRQIRRRERIKGLVQRLWRGKPTEKGKAPIPETPRIPIQPRRQLRTPTVQDLSDSLSLLMGYSFLTSSQHDRVEDTTFTLHRLVHLALQWEMKRSEQIANYTSLAMFVISNELPRYSAESLPWIRRLIPHINATLDHAKTLVDVDWYWPAVAKASLLADMGWFLVHQNTGLNGTQWMWPEAIRLLEETVGPAHTRTLGTKREFGYLLQAYGHYEEAVEILEAMVYSDDEDINCPQFVATSLSQAYIGLGRIDEATGILDRAINRSAKHVEEMLEDAAGNLDFYCYYEIISERGASIALRGQLEDALAVLRWLFHKIWHASMNAAFLPLERAIEVLAAAGSHESENEALALHRVLVQLSTQAYGHDSSTRNAKKRQRELRVYKSQGKPIHQINPYASAMVKAVEERAHRLSTARARGQSMDNRSGKIEVCDEEPPASTSPLIMGIINEYRQGQKDIDNLPEDDWRKSWAWTHFEPYRSAWLAYQSSGDHDSEEETSRTGSVAEDSEEETYRASIDEQAQSRTKRGE